MIRTGKKRTFHQKYTSAQKISRKFNRDGDESFFSQEPHPNKIVSFVRTTLVGEIDRLCYSSYLLFQHHRISMQFV